MRWTVIVVLAFALGCSRTSPVQPTTTTPAASPAPFTMSGVVREAGTNAPIEHATVCWSSTAEPHCGETAADGSYRFALPPWPEMKNPSEARFCPGAGRSGFEGRQACIPWGDGAVWSPVLQRIIQIDAGRTVTATVLPEEGSGLAMMDDCTGCKRIRIAIPRRGTLALRLLAAPDAGLRLAVLGPDELQPIGGPIAVTAGETVTVVVLGAAAPAEFTLSTSIAN